MSKAKEYLKRVGLLQSPYISQERVIKHLEAFANEQIEAITVTRCCKSDSEQLPDVYLQELSKVEWLQQTQISTNEQLQILRQFANKLGLYDASDYLKK